MSGDSVAERGATGLAMSVGSAAGSAKVWAGPRRGMRPAAW